MGKIQVVNLKTYKGPGYYIGRGSPVGNPYSIGPFGTRLQVIELYKVHAQKQLKNPVSPFTKMFKALVDVYRRQGSLILKCFCDPLPCHGHYLRELIFKAVKDLE